MTNEQILKEQKIIKFIPYFIKCMDAARKDESEKIADEQLVKFMKEEPVKVIMWILAKLGMEMQESNVDKMHLSQEVTIDGVKYLVAANVTKKEICD